MATPDGFDDREVIQKALEGDKSAALELMRGVETSTVLPKGIERIPEVLSMLLKSERDAREELEAEIDSVLAATERDAAANVGRDQFAEEIVKRVQEHLIATQPIEAPLRSGQESGGRVTRWPSGPKTKRTNQRYPPIDAALRRFAQSKPQSHKEVFAYLDREKVVVPDCKPFKSGRSWLEGHRQAGPAASSWLSKQWKLLALEPFRKGPK